MKTLKLYDDFTKNLNESRNIEMINEEWFPQGPWMNLKSIPHGTLVEFWTKSRLAFVGGNAEHKDTHEEEIFKIIDILYSEKNVNINFNLHDVDDAIVDELVIYQNNIKGNKEQFLEKLKEYGDVTESGKELYLVKLSKPIIIEVEESEQKDLVKFNKKINKLIHLIEYADIKNTPETNDAIDKLIVILSQSVDEDDEDDE